MNLRRAPWLVLILVCCAHLAFSQFTIIPIPQEENKKQNAAGRTKSLDPMPIPFWDDFSFSNNPGFPHDTLWQYGASVSVNLGVGISPPSLGVATFDGLDSLGNPYNVNDVLAKGVADRLISRPLSMDLVPPAERNTVFLSFYFQPKGNGESPDPGDQLRVLFKNASGDWIPAWTIENDETLDQNVFTQVLIPITDDQYYHSDFQFSILSIGRLSGPYDTWNVDYVYLNKGRNVSDTSYPDRTITIPLTSMLSGYYAMPLDHFIENSASNLTAPLLSMHNLEYIPGNTNQSDVQPINYDAKETLHVYRKGSEAIYNYDLDMATSIGNPLQPLEFRTVATQTLPDVSDLTAVDSAARIKLKLWINSGDNVIPSMANPNGDYNPAKYSPIDFRANDTTQVEYVLDNYYAYDDGTAEYGAALNQPGAMLAYLFNMKTVKPDTIVALDLYFPKFGDEVNQSIQILILKDLSGDPGSFLHQEVVTIQHGTQNNFWRLGLNRLVGVVGQFYVGWKQSAPAVLAIGLDKSTNSADKIFYNINGTWEANINLIGSLMIRPIFGEGDGIVTGLPEVEAKAPQFYPNPSHGQFIITGDVQSIQVYDITGRAIQFGIEEVTEGKLVQLDNAAPGIYILKLRSENNTSAHRIRVD